MSNIISALNDNLKLIYRKSVDADAALNNLQNSGKGKFNTIFGDDTAFTTRAKRFGPYVEEIAEDVSHLVDADEATLGKALPNIVKKLELMLTTLEQFKQTL
ncbi:MAG: hypothetical protein WA981_11200 [Glaciecola sp.]